MWTSAIIEIFESQYPQALRECFNWAESREIFLDAATDVRARFDKEKNYPAGVNLLNISIFSIFNT